MEPIIEVEDTNEEDYSFSGSVSSSTPSPPHVTSLSSAITIGTQSSSASASSLTSSTTTKTSTIQQYSQLQAITTAVTETPTAINETIASTSANINECDLIDDHSNIQLLSPIQTTTVTMNQSNIIHNLDNDPLTDLSSMNQNSQFRSRAYTWPQSLSFQQQQQDEEQQDEYGDDQIHGDDGDFVDMVIGIGCDGVSNAIINPSSIVTSMDLTDVDSTLLSTSNRHHHHHHHHHQQQQHQPLSSSSSSSSIQQQTQPSYLLPNNVDTPMYMFDDSVINDGHNDPNGSINSIQILSSHQFSQPTLPQHSHQQHLYPSNNNNTFRSSSPSSTSINENKTIQNHSSSLSTSASSSMTTSNNPDNLNDTEQQKQQLYYTTPADNNNDTTTATYSSLKINTTLGICASDSQLSNGQSPYLHRSGSESGTSSSASAKKVTSRRNAWGNSSYAELIARAIDGSPDKRLTLSQIYEWMVQNVTYFKDKGDNNSSAGWKNSIRHNLSLHNRFKRIQNEGTGKSSWWVINPDAKPGKAPRRRAISMETQHYEKRRGRVKRKVEQLRMQARNFGQLGDNISLTTLSEYPNMNKSTDGSMISLTGYPDPLIDSDKGIINQTNLSLTSLNLSDSISGGHCLPYNNIHVTSPGSTESFDIFADPAMNHIGSYFHSSNYSPNEFRPRASSNASSTCSNLLLDIQDNHQSSPMSHWYGSNQISNGYNNNGNQTNLDSHLMECLHLDTVQIDSPNHIAADSNYQLLVEQQPNDVQMLSTTSITTNIVDEQSSSAIMTNQMDSNVNAQITNTKIDTHSQLQNNSTLSSSATSSSTSSSTSTSSTSPNIRRGSYRDLFNRVQQGQQQQQQEQNASLHLSPNGNNLDHHHHHHNHHHQQQHSISPSSTLSSTTTTTTLSTSGSSSSSSSSSSSTTPSSSTSISLSTTNPNQKQVPNMNKINCGSSNTSACNGNENSNSNNNHLNTNGQNYYKSSPASMLDTLTLKQSIINDNNDDELIQSSLYDLQQQSNTFTESSYLLQSHHHHQQNNNNIKQMQPPSSASSSTLSSQQQTYMDLYGNPPGQYNSYSNAYDTNNTLYDIYQPNNNHNHQQQQQTLYHSNDLGNFHSGNGNNNLEYDFDQMQSDLLLTCGGGVGGADSMIDQRMQQNLITADMTGNDFNNHHQQQQNNLQHTAFTNQQQQHHNNNQSGIPDSPPMNCPPLVSHHKTGSQLSLQQQQQQQQSATSTNLNTTNQESSSSSSPMMEIGIYNNNNNNNSIQQQQQLHRQQSSPTSYITLSNSSTTVTNVDNDTNTNNNGEYHHAHHHLSNGNQTIDHHLQAYAHQQHHQTMFETTTTTTSATSTTTTSSSSPSSSLSKLSQSLRSSPSLTSSSTIAYQLELTQTPSISIESSPTNNIHKNVGNGGIGNLVNLNDEKNVGPSPPPPPTQVKVSRSWVH
ncbi:hypothetical protein DERP_004862 [Dermatophagoides pteronyssinus]|uniref:Forkhead box protein O n=1 Tax=Dermatophagoides pteronyssinus TaxID=6956 RepID=A0ABQ8JSR4_DERPT|nr:hypothetical protein DERP_004862 [Dermatophagoides pteronyssinus]